MCMSDKVSIELYMWLRRQVFGCGPTTSSSDALDIHLVMGRLSSYGGHLRVLLIALARVVLGQHSAYH